MDEYKREYQTKGDKNQEKIRYDVSCEEMPFSHLSD